MSQELAQKMFDASVRIEKMFWIAGICAAPPDDFEEFCEDDLADLKEITAEFPWLAGMLEEGAQAEDVLAEFTFRRVDGIFAQVATPIPYEFHDSGSFAFTWGRYRTKWLFCRSLEEIVAKAVPWRDSVIAAERAKSVKQEVGSTESK